jgi:hypothetical protein
MTYKTDASFFSYIKPPGSYIGILEISRWFEKSIHSRYRLIIDNELDELYAGLNERDEFYPGIKTFAVVINPWARIKLVYDDLHRIEHELSGHAQGTFTEFVNVLPTLSRDTIWYNRYHMLSPQSSWLEYTQPDGSIKTVDYLFKAETLDTDFKVIQEYFENNNPLTWFNIIPKYKSHYTARTKKIVYDIFKEDIEKFGYKF